jgi:ATP-binding cassette subfamily B protein
MAVALASLVPPVARWVESAVQIRRGREAAAAILEFLGRKGETAEAPDAEFLPALTSGRLEFRQVTLRETGTERLLLDTVSFAVPAGTHVAVVGTDSDANRALMYLVPRFLDPTSGELRIQDKNIRWVTHESLAQVALVMHDDLLFSDTVLNNIGGGDPGYTLPQIIEAAKLAHAHQFIEKLPYGYETQVGDHGLPLRPGQRFRIALARAVLRDPSILIIEEPSGPIDEDTLALLDDTLERIGHGRTILFLAQRLSTLRKVDRVFLIRGGRLEGAGTHDDLWRTSDTYRRLPVVAEGSNGVPVGATEE